MDAETVSSLALTQLRPGRARLCFVVAVWAAFGGMTPQLEAQPELPSPQLLRVPSSRMPETRLESLEFDLRRGLGPDEAGVIAAYLNPALRSTRDRRGLAVAQLIQAGVLPNPQVSYT